MRLLLLSALVPVLLYCISYLITSIKAKKDGEPQPNFLSKRLLHAFTISLCIAIIAYLIILAVSISESQRNDYASPAQKLQKQYSK
jgi:hypothetical protein